MGDDKDRLEQLVFDLSSPGRHTGYIEACDVPECELTDLLPSEWQRDKLNLPELTEREVVAHFTRLSQLNYGLDTGFYPLGSCTMKYNPKVNEDLAALAGFAEVHPLQPEETAQGALQLMFELQRYLAEISGLHSVTLQPAAGAHGELTGLLMIRAYHRHRGEDGRRVVLVPDSAHGTNPASAALAGCRVINVPSNPDGGVNLDELRRLATREVAVLMLTIPNTLGLFDPNILEISEIVHQAGALLYCDGANMNAILGQVKLAELGCDVMHFNLHKTFSTPHGGGGPGAGPVAVSKRLAPFLPVPIVQNRVEAGLPMYYLDWDRPLSIGKIGAFYGNFAVLVKAYAYIRSLGGDGLKRISESAVLNANYLMNRLKEHYDLPHERACMHEFVLSGKRQKTQGVRTLDIAKRLLDFGYHPPTIYFPLLVDEALMIEPTETETIDTLDAFAETMNEIAREAEVEPDIVKHAPHNTRLGRLDEVAAARTPILRWQARSAN